MEKKNLWNADYDFAMLSMIQRFSDKELEKLGLSVQDISNYREFDKRNEGETVEGSLGPKGGSIDEPKEPGQGRNDSNIPPKVSTRY